MEATMGMGAKSGMETPAYRLYIYVWPISCNEVLLFCYICSFPSQQPEKSWSFKSFVMRTLSICWKFAVTRVSNLFLLHLPFTFVSLPLVCGIAKLQYHMQDGRVIMPAIGPGSQFVPIFQPEKINKQIQILLIVNHDLLTVMTFHYRWNEVGGLLHGLWILWPRSGWAVEQY